MSDVEDYRVKNAREGKALYFPGRPVEEIKAERDAANRKSLRLHLNVSLVEQDAWTMTANSAATNYAAAADTFDLLSDCIGLGAIGSDDPALASTLYLLGKGMRSLAETDGNALSRLGMSLGRASREDFDFIPREGKEKDQ